MDGLTLLARLRRQHPLPAIVISSQSSRDLARSHGDPAAAGFVFIEKPDGLDRNLDDFRRELANRLLALDRSRGGGREPGQVPKPVSAAVVPAARPSVLRNHRFRLIAIGASTGGVDAVHAVLAGMAAPLPPIVVVLHMPAAYTARFAERLARVTGHAVAEARDGETLQPGQVRISPGALHLRVESRAGVPVTRLGDDPPVCGHKPSVDVLFHSVAEAFAQSAMGVILTGMGRDGAEGLRVMRAAGAATIGQTSESCVVYGMPKAARDLGAVEHEVPLHAIGNRIMAKLQA
jgi:two-component system chemotaxis response regulator CheB